MSRSYFHRRHRKFWKAPAWWINMVINKPERRLVHVICNHIVNGADLETVVPQPKKWKRLPYW